MNALALIALISLLQAPHFDMHGTINRVYSPSSMVIGNETINKTVILDGVDASGLNNKQYDYLMSDIKGYFTGKSVLVNGSYAYLDLVGSYNAQSINEMIEKKISDLEQMPELFCEECDCQICS